MNNEKIEHLGMTLRTRAGYAALALVAASLILEIPAHNGNKTAQAFIDYLWGPVNIPRPAQEFSQTSTKLTSPIKSAGIASKQPPHIASCAPTL